MEFRNYVTGKVEAECAEQGFADRWFIKLGFAGFNSPANNRLGYQTKAKAEAACRRYQSKQAAHNAQVVKDWEKQHDEIRAKLK